MFQSGRGALGRPIELLHHGELGRAARSLAKAPVFSITAVSLLAIGFGATVAVLSVVNAIFLSGLPFAAPQRLVAFHASSGGGSCQLACSRGLTSREVGESAAAAMLAGIIAGATSDVVHLRSESPIAAVDTVGIVSWNLLPVLGVRTAFGRGFVKADEDAGAEPVAVLSHAFWQARFAADTLALGRRLTSDEGVFRIVGVLPAHVVLGPPIIARGRPAFLIPASAWVEQVPLEGFARLKDGATIEGFKSALAVLFARLPAFRPEEADGRWHITAVPLREAHAMAYAGSYPLLLASVLIVLGIVTANTAGLFLARLAGQRHEFGVRIALGADGFQVVAPALAQGVLIAGVAGLLGLLFAWVSTHVLATRAGAALPYWTSVTPSLAVTAVAAGLLCAMWLCFSAVPALVLARACSAGSVIPTSSTLSRSPAGSAIRRWLTTVELTWSFVLLSAAGLLAKTLFTALGRDVAVETAAAEVMLDTEDRRPRPLLPAAERLMLRLHAFPGVGSVGVAARGRAVLAPGLTREGDSEMLFPPDVAVFAEAVTADFFRAMGTTILEGRDFDQQDVPNSPSVIILGDSLAKRLFPNASAIGKRVKFGGPSTPVPWLTIVGVVREARCGRLATRCAYRPRMYMPATQGFPPGTVYIRARTSGSPVALLNAIPALVSESPGLRILHYGSVQARFDRELSPIRTHAFLTAAFALFAGGLAGVGLYGLLAYVTRLRSREIAIRIALGATAVDIGRTVVVESLPIVTVGLVLGGALSVPAGRAMRPILFDTNPADWTVIGGAGLLLLIVAIGAAVSPIKSAQRVDPIDALRAE